MTKEYVFDSERMSVDCSTEDNGRAFIVEIGPDVIDPFNTTDTPPFFIRFHTYVEDDNDSVLPLAELYQKGFVVTVTMKE